jgi:tetratricopeptide (TPR) repeat protein
MALALMARGQSHKATSQVAQAMQDFDAAIQYSTRALETNPNYNDARYQRNVALMRKGELLALDPNTTADGLKSLNESAANLESLMKEFSDNTSYREGVAVCLGIRSRVQLAMGQLSLAEKDATAARQHLQDLITEESRSGPTENAEYSSSLGKTFDTLSQIAMAKGDSLACRNHLIKAIENFTKCVRIDPFRRLDEDSAVECKARLEKLPAGVPATTAK